jgi:hypothetical protein
MFVDKKKKSILDSMALQIPGEARDRKFEHPEFSFHFTYTNGAVDRDGVIVTVLDLLQKYGVIVNDNISHCNGMWQVHPAVRGEYDSVRVVITPREEMEAPVVPRYRNPKKERMMKRLNLIKDPAPPPTPPAPTVEDMAAELPDAPEGLFEW